MTCSQSRLDRFMATSVESSAHDTTAPAPAPPVMIVTPQTSKRGSARDKFLGPGVEMSSDKRASAREGTDVATTEAGGSASIWSCSVNLANTIMGTGMLTLPYAFSQAGLVFGIFFAVLVAILGGLSLHLLLECRCVLPGATFTKVVEATFPGCGGHLLNFVIVFGGWGTCTAYLIVASDALGSVFQESPRAMWTFLGAVIVTPLCLLRTLDSLKLASVLAILALVVFAFVVFCYAVDSDLGACDGPEAPTPCPGPIDLVGSPFSMLHAVAAFLLAYGCQQNILPVAAELRDPTPARCAWAITGAYACEVSNSARRACSHIAPRLHPACRSISMACVIFLVVATAGYATFGNSVRSDILLSYPESALVDVSRVLMTIVVITSYPLQAYAARLCAQNLLGALFRALGRCLVGTGLVGPTNPIWAPHDGAAAAAATTRTSLFLMEYDAIGTAAVFIASTFYTALVVTQLGLMVELIGACGGTFLTFIAPGAAYTRLRGTGSKIQGPLAMRCVALVLLGVGVVMLPVSAVVILARVE